MSKAARAIDHSLRFAEKAFALKRKHGRHGKMYALPLAGENDGLGWRAQKHLRQAARRGLLPRPNVHNGATRFYFFPMERKKKRYVGAREPWRRGEDTEAESIWL